MFSKTTLFTLAAAATAVSAGHNGTIVTTTKVVDVYTTYCPEPTIFELGDKTYTVEKPTTLTITDCPCTIVEPCYTCEAEPTGPVKSHVNPPAEPTSPVNPPPAEPTKPAVHVTSQGHPAEPTLAAGAEQVGIAAMAGLAALGLFL